MTLIQGIYQRLISVLLAVSLLSSASYEQAKIGLRIEEKALTVTESAVAIQTVEVFAKGSSQPLFGTFQDRVFVPSVAFVRGQSYEVALQLANGSKSKVEVTLGRMAVVAPDVRLSPAASQIPANTLKLYLDFSQPMEQGDFLSRVSLQRRNGQEVAGAFRETELWSPDGKRLTIMFHPGRQKTGVNLNVDEGPVLIEGERYNLVISGQWRSTTGAPLGKEAVFGLQPVAVDHGQPDPSKWRVFVPKAGTKGALVVMTDEMFEPQIFTRAVQMPQMPGKAESKVVELRRIEWRFTPEQPWKAGKHEISIDPMLEDLAGNNLLKPMEVDLTAAPPQARPSVLTFEITRP